MKHLAKLKLNPGTHQVAGPPELVIWISRLTKLQASREAINAAYDKKLQDYYVICAVTGEKIALPDLKYWNVERQEPYKDAEAGLKAHNMSCLKSE